MLSSKQRTLGCYFGYRVVRDGMPWDMDNVASGAENESNRDLYWGLVWQDIRVRLRLRIPRSKNEWILALLGGGIAVACVIPLAQGFSSLSWPKVDGVITRSQDRAGYRVMGVDIGYRYATGGHAYTGDRFRFQFVLTAQKMLGRDVQSILGHYRVGEPVKVAVNPRNAADSVLEPGPDFETAIPLAMGLFLLLLALGEVRKDEPSELAASLPVAAKPHYWAAKGLGLAAIALLLVCAFNLYHGTRSMQWPSVEGRILYSHARVASSPEALLWYEYTVDNHRYLASRYRNGGNITPFARVAQAAAKRYPVGRTVPVFYDPANPHDALLEPGVWWGNFVAGGFGLVLLFIAWVAKKYTEVMATRK